MEDFWKTPKDNKDTIKSKLLDRQAVIKEEISCYQIELQWIQDSIDENCSINNIDADADWPVVDDAIIHSQQWVSSSQSSQLNRLTLALEEIESDLLFLDSIEQTIRWINISAEKWEDLKEILLWMNSKHLNWLIVISDAADTYEWLWLHSLIRREIFNLKSLDWLKDQSKEIKIKFIRSISLQTLWIEKLDQINLSYTDLWNNELFLKAKFDKSIPEKEVNVNIESFKNKSNKILVICANQYEFHSFCDDASRSTYWLEVISKNDNKATFIGSGWREFTVIMPEDTWTYSPYKDKIDWSDFWIIQLKWHIWHMPAMIHALNVPKDNSTIIIWWWCRSESYTDEILKKWCVPITNREIWESVRNDHLCIRLSELINNKMSEWSSNSFVEAQKEYIDRVWKNSAPYFLFPDNEAVKRTNHLINSQ
jgi:hypothetical protein